jgi:predicted metal-binding membrane protein
LIAVALAALVVLAWGYLLVWSKQMSDDASIASMPGMRAMPNMPYLGGATQERAIDRADGAHVVDDDDRMMVPSAAPMILLFGNVQRRQLAAESPRLRVALFTAGYLAIWGAFSVLAAVCTACPDEARAPRAARSHRHSLARRRARRAGGRLSAHAAEERVLAPLPLPGRVSVEPLAGGNVGAFRMGIEHGLYCVGCCWLLMSLLFVVGS